MNLISEAEAFLHISRALPTHSSQGRNGAELAARLRSKAIDLSYNKATEFSSDIQRLHLLAAKIALVSHGPNSAEVERYEADVFYYKAFTPPHPIVAEYEAFKAACE